MNRSAEHKVPGGKLLRADVHVTDRIQTVELHGDFFIYPEESLPRIEAVFEDQPIDFGVEDLATQIEAAIDEDTELVGFTAKDVATVVQEAIMDEDE